MKMLRHLLVRTAAVLVLLSFLGAWLPSRSAAADQIAVSFGPDADTLVKQLFPGNNYGSFSQLRVDGFPIVRSYLRFSVRGLAGMSVAKAQLQIYANSNSRIGITASRVADNSWSEGSMTYTNAPPVGSAISVSGAFSGGNWVPLDLTSYVTGEGTYSVALTTSGFTAISLASREAGANTAPRLVLLLETSSPPTETPTPQFTDTPGPTSEPPATDTPVPPPPPATDTPVPPPPAATDTPQPGPTDTPTATVPVNTDTPVPSPTPTSTDTPVPGPSGSIQHFFLVMMENKGYDQVWNVSSAPYIASLGNTYSRADNFRAITHPSLPNYLDLVGGSNYGITTDCSPASGCDISASNLADTLESRGLSWKAYQESMPAPCYLTVSGNYAPKHNPFVYFQDIYQDSARCSSHDVPYTAFFGDLASASTTPSFALITPNLCNDMHDCTVGTGDTWLQNNVSPILVSPACTLQKCLVVITWDEDNGNYGNHILTIFAGSGAQTGGYASAAAYNHFSLLRTIEGIFGLPALTGNDGSASPMTDMLR